MIKQINVKKMSKKDLLELLVMQSKKIDELQIDLEETKELLKSKQILIKEAGSIAEASLRLNKIFESAQETADQYLESIKRLDMKKKEKVVKRKSSCNKKTKNIKGC